MEIGGFGVVLISAAFLVVNVTVLRLILWRNRVTDAKKNVTTQTAQQDDDMTPTDREPGMLDAAQILGWEFEYARISTSEAMAERHTMVNFYLLVAGIVTTGAVAVLARAPDLLVAAIFRPDNPLPPAAGSALFWVLIGIGWLDFLAIIRLRQAWHGSAEAMNRIKAFYIEHVAEMDPATLRSAFLWQPDTLPPADKPWTVFFYSAMLIAFLNSAAFVAGGALLDPQCVFNVAAWWILGCLAVMGLVFFAFHVWLYFAFLRAPD